MNYPYYPQYYPQQYVPPVPPVSTINGKVVESIDIVKGTEVPLGGYGVFPQADLSQVFIKAWNNDGTTRIVTYVPVVETTPEPEEDAVLRAIKELSKKIDSFSPTKPNVVRAKKKEEDDE